MDLMYLFLDYPEFSFTLFLFWFLGTSIGSLSGGEVPMDLVCLHGKGDPHGDSGLYTRSLSDSSCFLGGFGVGSCLKDLAVFNLVSQKSLPPDALTQCGNHQWMYFFR